MDSFKKLKIGTQLSLGFGMLTALMLVLAVFSVMRVSSLAKAARCAAASCRTSQCW